MPPDTTALLDLLSRHLDPQDILQAAAILQRTGGHLALVGRLRHQAGLILAAQHIEAGELLTEPVPSPDPDYTALAKAWKGEGEARYADLEPLAVELGIVARRWPSMLIGRGKVADSLQQRLGRWLSLSGWPRRKERGALVYTVPRSTG